jgi:hypothetical protein
MRRSAETRCEAFEGSAVVLTAEICQNFRQPDGSLVETQAGGALELWYLE